MLSIEFGVWASVILAAAAITAALFRHGKTDILPYLAAYFFAFGFGPAIEYLRGGEIFKGTNIDKLPAASAGLLLAVLATVLVSFCYRRTRSEPSKPAAPRERVYPLIPVALVVFAAYGFVAPYLLGLMHGATKTDKISLAGDLHYSYLILEMCAVSLYFVAQRSATSRLCYWLNLAGYVHYCLFADERDFVFAIFGLLIHVQFAKRKTISLWTILAGAGFALLATHLFTLRVGATTDVSEVLNQGSVMFVDTYVMSHVPGSVDYQYGMTYLYALADRIPGDSPLAGFSSLAQWLVHSYAPGNKHGYGFSLSGEAYMNFGMLGIPLAFAIIALVQKFFFLRMNRSDFCAYASVFVSILWMYAFRGESAMLIRASFCAVVFYFGLIAVGYSATRTDRVAEPRKPAAGPASVHREELKV